MLLFIVCALIVGFLCCLILIELCQCIKIRDKSKATKPKVIAVPKKADIKRHNAQVEQQRIIKDQQAKQHIIDILDIAYKDYVDKQIKKGKYISYFFTLNSGDYALTSDEIYAIHDKSFRHGIYEVEYRYEDYFKQHYLVVTVEYIRKEN